MLQLSADPNFHFELLRILASARCYGADVAEILKLGQRIEPGNTESWYEQFYDLAQWVLSTIDPNGKNDKVTLRDAYFRASRYLFAAGFFLVSGTEEDPRLASLWKSWSHYFDQALRVMEIPPERLTLKADGFEIPIIVFRASLDNTPRPVIILGNGLDGSMEEMLHANGFPALERGYHVVLYEGPGQHTCLRQSNVGFIHDWERAVTPVVDHLQTLDFVDKKRIGLLGLSLGGYLAARVACFEHRLAAVACVDGMNDVYANTFNLLPRKAAEHLEKGEEEAFEEALRGEMTKSTNLKWLMHQISWTFKAPPYQAMQLLKKMKIEQWMLDQVQCPVFVADAEHDLFVTKAPQAKPLADGLGSKATLVRFTEKESAEAHCHIGATVYLNQVLLEWFRDVMK